jgi:hypothetical protein
MVFLSVAGRALVALSVALSVALLVAPVVPGLVLQPATARARRRDFARGGTSPAGAEARRTS